MSELWLEINRYFVLNPHIKPGIKKDLSGSYLNIVETLWCVTGCHMWWILKYRLWDVIQLRHVSFPANMRPKIRKAAVNLLEWILSVSSLMPVGGADFSALMMWQWWLGCCLFLSGDSSLRLHPLGGTSCKTSHKNIWDPFHLSSRILLRQASRRRQDNKTDFIQRFWADLQLHH